MLRNGRRQLVAWRVSYPHAVRVELEAERYLCRRCAREVTDQDGVRAELAAGMRRHLMTRVAHIGLKAAAAEVGWDARTVSAHATREMDDVLAAPIPAAVEVRVGSGASALMDSSTGAIVEIAGIEPDHIVRVLRERGEDVERLSIPMDPRLRNALEDALPDVELNLHRDEFIPRLNTLLHAAGLGPDRLGAALLADRIRARGWDEYALVKLREMMSATRHGIAAAVLGAWGGEITNSLAQARDGPYRAARKVPPGPVLRLRAIVAFSAPSSITLDVLGDLLSKHPLPSKETT